MNEQRSYYRLSDWHGRLDKKSHSRKYKKITVYIQVFENRKRGNNRLKIILEIPDDLIKIGSTEKIVKVYDGASCIMILSTLYLDHIEPDGQIIFKSPLLEYYLDNYPDAREMAVE